MTVGPVLRDDETAAFFDGTARGEFLLRYCPDGHPSSPHARLCDTRASALDNRRRTVRADTPTPSPTSCNPLMLAPAR